ncbi:MAG: penicillin-binding protein 2, partial [Pseudomonadota bacterium]|nr:penicillin-binding protein 2 [Pseudomonadota bacterium]
MIPRSEAYDQSLSLHAYRSRANVAIVLILLCCLVLLARFGWLQVAQYEHYHTLAEANRIAIAPVVPTRGLILDRQGQPLANNYSAYTLEITPGRVDDLDATIDALATIIEIAPRDRKRFHKLLDESHNFESLPLRNRLSEAEVARFAVNRYRFPGVEINARLFRNYPQGGTASHVIGYIGRINDSDLDRLDDDGLLANYRGSDHLGKVGVEQSYERELHGLTGSEQVETDAGGRAVHSLSRTEPVSGNDLVLSLDLTLQQIAEQAFGNRRGALVAIEPASGEILAFVSQPGFDPNLFVDGIDQTNWDALNQSADKPLTNRALRGLYPPGSTIKPFMALAGLHYGKRTADSVVYDPGYFALPGTTHHYRDWKPEGHGSVDLHRSIVQSCDTYYYSLANELGIDAVHDFLARFGFGERTGIDLDGEVGGVLPSRAWKRARFHQEWFGGETVIGGIGQGYNLMTPLQIASAVATLANHGVMMRPHLVHAIRDSRSGQTREVAPETARDAQLNARDLAAVRDAMVDVMRPGGTAATAGAGAPYSFAGKTGTAQVVGVKQNEKYVESQHRERNRDHAWFVGFAPADAPRIAIAVLVENGGHGGSAAAPIARQVADYWLLGKKPNGPAAELPGDAVPATAARA